MSEQRNLQQSDPVQSDAVQNDPSDTQTNPSVVPRRDFLKQASTVGASLAMASTSLPLLAEGAEVAVAAAATKATGVEPNMLGVYGPWAASIVGDQPARFSYLQDRFQEVNAWRSVAKERVLECLMQPEATKLKDIQVEPAQTLEDLSIERVSWQLPYGARTQAVVIKPKNRTGRLPAVLALHDHGGNKYFGHEKITRTPATQHELMAKHQEHYYGGKAWANELARRGYVVLVHDTFTFASRRVRMEDIPDVARKKVPPVDDDSTASIEIYNRFAAEHEHLVAKSLFCAGTTWPGVFTFEDQRALDYLCSRDDVDASRIGCAGLSGGGLRTVYLGGIDDRIQCACCVGMMSTWRDYLLHKSHTHTWMIYIPFLPRDLDYPEILALRVPKPTLVLNNVQDALFTEPEMRRADNMMRAIYEKAKAGDRYRCTFAQGPHKFDQAMQTEAFDWFDRWLG